MFDIDNGSSFSAFVTWWLDKGFATESVFRVSRVDHFLLMSLSFCLGARDVGDGASFYSDLVVSLGFRVGVGVRFWRLESRSTAASQ